MQKKHLGLVVLLLATVFLISGCWLKSNNKSATVNNLINNQNQNQAQNQDQVNNQATEIVNPSGEYTINELLSMKKPLKCSWKESITNKGDVTNIIYINGNKFYQDVAMGDIGHSYTVSNGEYLYIWNDFSDAASKIKNTETRASTVSGQENVKDSAGQEQKRDFICEKWTVDESVFIPPQDKDFKDITEGMGQAVQDLKENSGEYKQQSCDLCQKAPSQELKDSCRKNMQCDQ
jgi:hypothetical protein